MKQLIIFLFLAAMLTANAQEEEAKSKLKQYYLVLLTKRANRSQDSTSANRIQEEYLKNIGRLYEEGKIDMAGPFGDDTDWSGVFVFKVSSQEEVEKLLRTDAAISWGRLNYVIHPCWAVK